MQSTGRISGCALANHGGAPLHQGMMPRNQESGQGRAPKQFERKTEMKVEKKDHERVACIGEALALETGVWLSRGGVALSQSLL